MTTYAILTLIIAIATPIHAAAQEKKTEITTRNSTNIPRISRFSGQKVPRFASLAHNTVNGRAGPGLHYPIRWQYIRRGLPVIVIRESLNWRKIKDPGGEMVWVHKRMLAKRKTAILRKISPLYPLENQHSNPIAELHPGVIAEIKNCSPKWCHILIQNKKGHILADTLWGHKQ